VLWTGNGKWNSAYRFDGTNDYIQSKTNLVLSGNAFSVGVRVKPGSGMVVAGSYKRIMETSFSTGFYL
jgi:hypothetical protein